MEPPHRLGKKISKIKLRKGKNIQDDALSLKDTVSVKTK